MMNGCFFLLINGIREYYPNPRKNLPWKGRKASNTWGDVWLTKHMGGTKA
jgi:hypothetical protein